MTLGFLASHRGTNIQAVIDACRAGRLHATPAVVICNNRDAEALERARQAGIVAYHLSGATHPEPDALDHAILAALTQHAVDVVLLAGYLKKLGPRTIARYRGRIVNVHPALLPKFGGHGMYGARVHEAVLASGDRETGVSIHVVDEEYDHGDVIAQCRIPVEPGDTVERLAARVLAREHAFLVETLEGIATGTVKLPSIGSR
jgi:phosphoribosylglycinamide formyltransferase-1